MTKEQQARNAKKLRFELSQLMRNEYPIEKLRAALSHGTIEQAAECLSIDVETLCIVLSYYVHKVLSMRKKQTKKQRKPQSNIETCESALLSKALSGDDDAFKEIREIIDDAIKAERQGNKK